MLKIAVGKGRIESKFFGILEKSGVTLKEASNRALKLFDTDDKYQFSPIKPSDVPAYVEAGAFDVGVVGIDSVWEAGKDVYELMDLGFSICSMCVAGLDNEAAKQAYFSGKPMVMATKYVNIASRTFLGKNITDIIQLTGSVEVAPLMDLAGVIFDIVETGTTLRENGLAVYDEIYRCSAIVIANKMSLKTRRGEIDELLAHLRAGSED